MDVIMIVLFTSMFDMNSALLREVCNMLIMQCTNAVDPASIFQGEPDEQLLKLRNALAILNHFMYVL